MGHGGKTITTGIKSVIKEIQVPNSISPGHGDTSIKNGKVEMHLPISMLHYFMLF
jgi:hypothetical protein